MSRAEREGFEPSKGFNPLTPLAGERLRPLSHLSYIPYTPPYHIPVFRVCTPDVYIFPHAGFHTVYCFDIQFRMILSFLRKKTGQKKRREDDHVLESVSRYSDNPVISPDAAVPWKSWQTFNPTAVLLDGKVHVLYRAIGTDGISRFGYASSDDGFTVDACPEVPAYEETEKGDGYTVHAGHSGGSWFGCEDPRLVHMKDEDTVYLTYTSCVAGLRMAISSIPKDDFVARRWDAWKNRRFMSKPGQIQKNWVLFPEKINGRYAICHSLNPLSVDYLDSLDFDDGSYIESSYNPAPPSGRWDSYMRGVGPAPLRTDDGWLVFYHAMNHEDMSRYKIGAMLLDLKDPRRILHRSERPIIVPKLPYEQEGYKGGVVYVTGSVIKEGRLLLYYGAADSFSCVAFADLRSFLDEMKRGTQTVLSPRGLVKFFRDCLTR